VKQWWYENNIGYKALWFNNPQNRSNLNCRNRNLNNDNNAFGMTLVEVYDYGISW